MTLFWAQQYFEPKYGPVYSLETVSEEHFAWLEDWLSTAVLVGFSIVGYLVGPALQAAGSEGLSGGRPPEDTNSAAMRSPEPSPRAKI